MPTGNDMQFGAAKEVTYGTRVAPSRFFEILPGESFGIDRNYYRSGALGASVWKRRRVQTTRGGQGSFTMEVPVTGFGFWLDLLHGGTPTVQQQAATAAYLQTHSLASAPTKSASVQLGRPPTTGSVLPFDYVGCMVSDWTFAWEPEGVLTFSPTLDIQDEKVDQTLATVTVPTDFGLFSFQGGSITIGGATVADIGGGGSVTGSWPLRTDFFPLGSSGLKKKPTVTDRPSVGGSVTADFVDMTHYNRVINGTLADVVLTFEGATIASTYKERIVITIPDCGFTGQAPTVDSPGPLQQTVTFENDSQTALTADIPSITYQSTDTAI